MRQTNCPRCNTRINVKDESGTICTACGNEYVPYPKMTEVQRQVTYAVEIVAAAALLVALLFFAFVMWYAGLPR